jgi:hypothetical protein
MTFASAPDVFDVQLPPAPYPGLRPFSKSEWPIFFGREKMTDAIVARLTHQHLLVVHGDSGCGKSSLIGAGVLPRLELESARGELQWRTCITLPREAPLKRLAESLAALDEEGHNSARVTEMRRILNFGADAPARLSDALLRTDRDHICILIDQFEELFEHARQQGRDEAKRYISFLVSVLKQPPRGIYAILTMRSEFLGICAQFPGFAEAVNEAQYLLPRMDEPSLVRAIREPARLYGGFVTAQLAERLILDADVGQDQLPLIQHGLMVLSQSRLRHEANPPEKTLHTSASPQWRLDVDDYSALGNLQQQLSSHADRVADSTGSPGRTVEFLFRALTDINAEGQAVRRPQTFANLLAITGSDEQTLTRIIDAFRAEGVSFLRPYGAQAITPDTLIDISHEALIRCWRRIADAESGWLMHEFQDGLVWRSLLVQVRSFELDPANVLSPATAEERHRWLAERTRAWADRYGGGWDRVEALVDASLAASESAKAAERRRARQKVWVAGAIAVLLSALSLAVLWQNSRVNDALDRANRAAAASLWTRLQFESSFFGYPAGDDALNAAWELRFATPQVRAEFLRQMSGDTSAAVKRAVQLGNGLPIILRALTLRPSPDASRRLKETIVQGLNAANDRNELASMAGVMLLADTLSSEELNAAVETLVTKIDPTSPTGFVFHSGHLPHAVGEVAHELRPEIAQRALSWLLEGLRRVNFGDRLDEYGVAARALAARMESAQARETLLHAVAVIDAPDEGEALSAYAAALRELAARLTTNDAELCLPVVRDRLDTSLDFRRREALAQALRIIGTKLPSDQSATTLAPLLSQLQAAMDNYNVEQLLRVLSSLPAYAHALSSAQAQSTFRRLLFMVELADRYSLCCQELLTLNLAFAAEKLTPEEARAVFPRLLKVSSMWLPYGPLSVVPAVEGLARSLTGDQPRAASPRLLAAMTGSNFGGAAANALARLADRLTNDDAASAFATVVTSTRQSYQGSQLQALGNAAKTLAPRLRPDDCVRLLEHLQKTIDASLRVHAQALALQLDAVVGGLPEVQVATAFAEMVNKVTTIDAIDRLYAYAPALQTLAARLSAGQAPEALRRVIAGMRAEGGDQRPTGGSMALILERLGVLAGAVQSLAPKLSDGDREKALDETRAALAWAPTTAVSVSAAAAAVSLLPRNQVERSVQTIVELLKYPMAAGDATAVLLDGLKAIAPEAPGNEAGLEANLNWIARTFPGIDLEAPPACPASRWPGLSCPTLAF